jgi:hypothetical protein
MTCIAPDYATSDPAWTPLLPTPAFQEYPSGPAGVSSAAASVPAAFYGDDTSFTVTSAGLPGVQRDFTSFAAAVAQVEDARVYAGFHYASPAPTPLPSARRWPGTSPVLSCSPCASDASTLTNRPAGAGEPRHQPGRSRAQPEPFQFAPDTKDGTDPAAPVAAPVLAGG